MSDRALLEAIAQPLAAGELPSAEACEAVADRLMLAGAGGAAARWRSWALLPPEHEQLLAALGEATFVLCEPEDDDQAAWAPVLSALEHPASAETLDALVSTALQAAGGLPPLEVAEGLVGRLEQAGAARAALRMLEVMWLEQRSFGLTAPALCNRMGRLWRQLGDPYQAELRFRLSLDQVPEQPLAWFQLAKVLLEQGLPDRALFCAEQGLLGHPGHDWGLKLRIHALRAMGGWASLEALQQQGLWPADLELCAAVERDLAAARIKEQRARRLRAQAAPPVSEELRQWAAAISARPGPLVLLQARSGAAVGWLIQTGLWPADRRVQPVASRDPWRVRQELLEAGASVGDEQQLVDACSATKPVAVVLSRAAHGALPLALKPWLDDPAITWIAPTGLVRPPAAPPAWRGAGWMAWGGR